MKTFVLVGSAGYIAPRHMKAIRETGHSLIAAYDVNDSVGVIDSHFPTAEFFTEFEELARFVDGRRSQVGSGVDYVSICSPNMLHNAHCQFAMRAGADVICEKPLVLHPGELDELAAVERETGRRVSTILQLRLHPSIVAFKERVAGTSRKHDVDLTYVTSRGPWYLKSWKGDAKRSGGIAANIGVHLFDMLGFVFGPVQDVRLHHSDERSAAGYLEFAGARVRWLLSIDSQRLPQEARDAGATTYRSITCDGETVEFSGGFTDLHTRSYEEILAGRGFGLEDSRSSIETIASLRDMRAEGAVGEFHPGLLELLA